MVNSQYGESVRGENVVSSVDVPSVPGEVDGAIAPENRIRRGSAGVLRSHNAHVKAGVRRDAARCGFCREGLGAVLEVVRRELPADLERSGEEAEVVSGGGVDEDGPASPSSDRKWPWE